MTEQETHTEWGVRLGGTDYPMGSRFDAEAHVRIHSHATLLSRQMTDWSPVEEPARMAEPTEFGSMVEASTASRGRVWWSRYSDRWYGQGEDGVDWSDLVDPRPYTPGGAS